MLKYLNDEYVYHFLRIQITKVYCVMDPFYPQVHIAT